MHLQLIPLALLLAGPADAADRGPTAYPRAGLLIEARELADPKAAERFRVLDARGKHRYQAGHVPGAVWVDQTTWSREFARGQEPEAWGQRLGRLGIDAETPVVVYDDNSAKDAARVWWILRYWGVRDVRLLNGGWRAWEAGGGMASTEEPAVPAKHPRLEPQSDRLARKEYVLGEVRGKRSQILDARSTGEYCGQEQTARRNGAIPGAVHLEWVEVLQPGSQRFKSPEQLSRLLQERGVDLGKPSITYCQSGGRAAVLAFALELMGARDVRNYYRSWSEWGNADDTPVDKPTPRK